ncbi:MAG: hypothetical protein IT200_18085 [Thermoleophilia bacterium]|nr:hypothetical protein [Thermoleophilia bacterium]
MTGIGRVTSVTELIEQLRIQQRRLRATTAGTAGVLDEVAARMLRDHPEVRIARNGGAGARAGSLTPGASGS